MAERIDELQLLIGSDASSAIRQLGNLAGALDNAATSARKLSSATGFANHFVGALSKLSSVNLDRTINNLERLSRLRLDNLKDKTVTIQLRVLGADETERAKYASQDAAKEISKNSMQIAKALGQKFNVDTTGIRDLSQAVKEMLTDFANEGNGGSAQEKMFGIIAQRGKESEASIMGVENRYKEFISWMNSQNISTTGITSSAERENALANGMLSNFRKSAVGIDQIWEEVMGKFPEFFDAIERSASNPSDQLDILARKMAEVRAMLEKHEIIDDSTFDNIGTSIQGAAEKAFSDFGQRKDQFMRESMDKIPIDLNIDQNRFENQIQQAITKATGKTYETQPIKLNLDNQKIRDSVEAAFSMVDIAKLPQFAQNFEKVAQSISAMNQTNIKDTGINTFANALRRLVETDTSKFDVNTIKGIADAIKDMASIGNVNKALNSFVSSIAKLANAGDKTGQTASGLKKLTPELKSAITTFSALGSIDATITSFVASIAKLATAGGKAGETAKGLANLTQAVVEFINAISSAPEVNTNIANTIQGLGNLASAGTSAGKAMNSVFNGGGGTGGHGIASSAVNTAISSTVNSFKRLLNAALSLGGQGASALGKFLAQLRLIPSQATSIDRTALSFTNLLRAVIPFYGLRGLFNWGKEAFEAGSSIVELENVIDTSFGSLKKGYEDISGYIYKWAQGTIDAFGVSQIAAERYAGRLMAMFNSSGFDATEGMRDSAAKMSTELIERAGDIASFYDMTVDEAMTKMQAALAGMNRPMRSLGVNMTVANLQSYALSQGITTAWKEMDQATQMALRYQYILNATQYAAGDFGRTALSSANQVRLLQLNTQQLSATIGQGLISAIAPVISWLNLLIKRLIQAATAFRTFMWTLFGKPLQAARGMSDDTAGYLDDASNAASGLADGAGGAADGLGSAGKAAKNLKKQLQVLPFDELNQLAKDTESAGSGGGGAGGGGGIGGGGLGAMGLLDDLDTNFDLSGNKALDAVNKWAQKIKDAFNKKEWKRMGIVIAEGLNEGLAYLYDALDWKKWEPRIKGFIRPFQIVVNNLINSLDWDLLGRTIARGLNLITNTFRIWINGFEWRIWGRKLAEGMNGLLDEWDADAFGRAIADKFRAAWNFFGGWVRKFDFSLFGKRLKEAVLGAIDELDWADMGASLATLFNGISDTIIEFLEDGQVANKIGEAFSEFVNNFISTFDEKKAEKAMQTVKTQIANALGTAIRNIDKTALAEDFKTVLRNLPWGTIGLAIGTKAGFDLAKGIFGTAFKLAAAKAIISAGSGATVGVKGAGATAAGTGGTAATAGAAAGGGLSLVGVVGGITALIGAMKGVQSAVEVWTRSKGLTPAEDRMKGKKMFADDYDADVVSGKPATPIDTGVSAPSSTTATSTTIVKATEDKSFSDAFHRVVLLNATKISSKVVNGETTPGFNKAYSKLIDKKNYDVNKNFSATETGGFVDKYGKYIHVRKYDVSKNFAGSETGGFIDKYGKYIYIKKHNVTKNYAGTDTGGFVDKYGKYIYTKKHDVSKGFQGVDQGHFVDYYNKLTSLPSEKFTKIKVSVDVYSEIKKVLAKHSNGTQTLFELIYEHARGGLFDAPAALHVFGEAGAEAAIPLERKSTMKRIANAIVDSGGMNGIGAGSGLAQEIAAAVAPYIMSAVAETNNRPLNVNATLYTENNEVLARAVHSGQKSLDKRYNPVSQFSY